MGRPKSEKSKKLYDVLLERGYPEPVCDMITQNLNTDFTATWMLRYLSHEKQPSLEELGDEMVGILENRNRIMQKKAVEQSNAFNNNWRNSRKYNMEEDEE